MERRLSAILAADMVGFSRLMEADEVGTLERQKTHRAELIDPEFEKYRGRIVKEMGDGVLVEFPSVVEAVQCAVIIQREMSVREANVVDEQRIQYRIGGINLGDIIIENDDIFGDGVNVAARLEQLADPGGVCISGTAYDHLKSKVEVGYESLGDVPVKNIKQAVRVYRVLTDPDRVGETIGEKREWLEITRRYAAVAGILLITIIGGGIWWWQQQPDFEPVAPGNMALAMPSEPSIAVLPFDYIGADKKDNEYLAEGLSESITTHLGKIPELVVIARNSSFTYKGKSNDVRDVSQKFGVRYVLDGSVQRSGNRLRVTAQLVDAVAGKNLWSESYDRSLEDYFAIQDEITLSILHTVVDKTITGGVVYKDEFKNLDAFAEFTKGETHRLKFTPEGNIQARNHFDKVLELAPNNPSAFSSIAFTHIMDARLGFVANPGNSVKLSERFVELALMNEPNHARAVNIKSLIRVVQKRGDEARKLSLRAMELAPGSAGIIASAGWVFKYTGDAKRSLPLFARAKRLQPVHQWWLVADEFIAMLDAGEYQTAFKLTSSFLGIMPEVYMPASLLAAATSASLAGKNIEAKRFVDRALKLKPDISIAHIRLFDLAYIDPSIPEKRYVVLRKLGIPETPPLKLPDKPSIAVLPFANMSNDSEQKYFADGMAEDIITDLSKLSGLFVIARNSSFRYRGDDIDLKRVGRELGVKYVLEGSVRRSGNRLRINAQLIDTQNGGHLWAERYDGNLEDVFALQDKISNHIVKALSLNLAPEEISKIERQDTTNLAAYEAFLKGQEYFAMLKPGDMEKAIVQYKDALAQDPKFTRAAVALARSFHLVRERGWVGIGGLPIRAATAELITKYVNIALAINKDTAEAHAVNALNLYYTFPPNFDEGVVEARLGVKLDPNSATTHFGLGKILVLGGEPKMAIKHLNAAKRLDPAGVAEIEEVLAYAHFGLEDFRSALKHAQTAWSAAPETSSIGYIVAASHSMLDEVEKAAIAMKRLNALRKAQLQPPFTRIRLSNGISYWYFKKRKDADRFKNSLLKDGILE